MVVGSGEDATENDKDVADLAAGNLYFIWDMEKGNSKRNNNSNLNLNDWDFLFYIALLWENKYILLSCSWHQTTNSLFPNFSTIFFSVWVVEKENKKIVEKIGENKLRCLVVWCHEQDICRSLNKYVRILFT